ncbi:helix-turn-helix domain-containing protein [Microbacterium sp. MAHUQ-60]|uniref:helix-turn-helix domain-containing protein n=1 Tax=unclassified Microbacterium TaxID=2609290 RepID=UPI003620E9AF
MAASTNTTPTDLQEWVSIEAAANLYDVSRDTIRRMISRGEIEAVRFGPRLIRVNIASIPAAVRSIGGGAL